MMNVLDALRYRLGGATTDLEGERIDPGTLEALGLRGGGMLSSAPQSQLPAGLPLVVQDSILKRPSYQEGGRYMVPGPYYNPNMGEPNLPDDDPRRREDLLANELGFNRYLKREGGQVWPEAQTGFMRFREQGQSPFASPLNQLLQRGPFALY